MQSHREEAGQVRAGERGPRLCRALWTSGETWARREEGADRPPRASLSPGGGGRGGLAMRATRE